MPSLSPRLPGQIDRPADSDFILAASPLPWYRKEIVQNVRGPGYPRSSQQGSVTDMDFSRLRLSLFLLFTIIVSGTTCYVFLEDMTLIEAFYMTMITISTVGFSEVKPLSDIGRLLTVIIIISGICVLTYTLGQAAQMFIEGELRLLLGRKKLEKKISTLKDHYII
jgi:hypothetical protein